MLETAHRDRHRGDHLPGGSARVSRTRTASSWRRGDRPGSPFLLLSSVEDPDVGFVVVPPWVFYPEYEFELDTGTAERLGLTAAEDAVVFVGRDACANGPKSRR